MTLADEILKMPTGKPPQNAADKAFKRAVQAIGLLAALGRKDLLTALREEICRREKEME